MANNVKFEGKDRRMPGIEKFLADNGLGSLEECRDLCLSKGIDVDAIVKGVQPIAFENAVWAYTMGVALALKRGITDAAEAAAVICRLSACPALLPTSVRLVWVTAIWVRCC